LHDRDDLAAELLKHFDFPNQEPKGEDEVEVVSPADVGAIR